MLEKFLTMRSLTKKGSSSGGGASSWNDLTDRPFGEEKAFEPIVWDKTKEYTTQEANGFPYYRIADYSACDPNQMDTVFARANVDGEIMEKEVPIAQLGATFVYDNGWEAFQGSIYASNGQQEFSGIIFPDGIWFCAGYAPYEYFQINPKTTVKTIDPQYLPNVSSVGVINLNEHGIDLFGMFATGTLEQTVAGGEVQKFIKKCHDEGKNVLFEIVSPNDPCYVYLSGYTIDTEKEYATSANFALIMEYQGAVYQVAVLIYNRHNNNGINTDVKLIANPLT